MGTLEAQGPACSRSDFSIWLEGARPKTLPAAVAPVILGAAFARAEGQISYLLLGVILVTALLIQIATNLWNDYFDAKKGSDTEERSGPRRLTASGLVEPQSVKRVALSCMFLSLLGGMFLVAIGGWPILLIGIASLFLSVVYTASRFALAYTGLADIFVILFFGCIPVAGTYYLLTASFSWATVIAGLAPGLLATAILTTNNLRDIAQDRAANKLTLAVRFGERFARFEYTVCVVLALLIPLLLTFDGSVSPFCLASVLAFTLAIGPLRTVWKTTPGKELNNALAQTGKLVVLHSLLFSAGLLI